MADKVFVIGIGGTGMRCLESFVHTCAIGMYDNTEIEMLALDTDEDNGNFKRLESLVNCYRSVNGGNSCSDTFFSAKINYHSFSPGYKQDTTFDKISNYSTLSGHRAEDPIADLVDLFVDSSVREMPLKEGYRAQTQMGSLLMYHAIVHAGYKAKYENTANGISEFINALSHSQKAPVFIFGSVFGGTGASSIPIIPRALRRAAEVMEENTANVSDHPFGTIVLTSYFQFDSPQRNNEVVAKSSNFAVNSQAALMFYNNDKTVNSTYSRMYLLGRDAQRSYNKGIDQDSRKASSIGGSDQKNPADYIELLAASAAWHFFDEAKKGEEAFRNDQGNKAFCIAKPDGNGKLDFPLFWQENSDMFKRKMCVAVAASILQEADKFYDNVAKTSNMFEQVNVESERFKNLCLYWKMFNLAIKDDKTLENGWLPQMYHGCGGQGLLFKDTLFQCRSQKDLQNFKFNKDLFDGGNPPQFSVGVFESRFDVVKKAFNKAEGSSTTFEDMLKKSYKTLMNLYFNI